MTLALPVYIPSRGRSKSIVEKSLVLFPKAILVVDQIEADAYRQIVPEAQLLFHPSLQGTPAIRNWIFDQAAGDHVQADDDIEKIVFRGASWSRRAYRDPDLIEALLASTAQCARDAGAFHFGFSQQPNPIHYKPMSPFILNQWVGGVVGYLTGHGLRYDPQILLHADVDICLQALMKHRIVWMDSRWSFVQDRLTNAGGLNSYRTAEVYQTAHVRLKAKWGAYVEVSAKSWDYRRRRAGKTEAKTLLTKVRVRRKQLGKAAMGE